MNYYKSISAMLLLLGSPLLSSAQAVESSGAPSQYQLEIILGLSAVVLVMALVALSTALYALMSIVNLKKQAELGVQVETEGFWTRLWKKMNDSVPIEKEDTVMTDHTYDGIRELDNKLPPWWLYGFYLTIVFAVAYFAYYHVFDMGELQEAEYQTEMQTAEREVAAYLASMDNLIDESSVTFTGEEADLNVGKELFVSKCAACHGQMGEGGVGPNLADQYWIHGGDVKSIFKTIKYGVPSKGMISWKAQMSPKEIQQVSSFIYTLEGTNPPNAKEAQGDLVERESADAGS